MIDLTASTLDELVAEFARLAGVVVATEDDRKSIHKEIEHRRSVARIAASGLTPEDIAALGIRMAPK